MRMMLISVAVVAAFASASTMNASVPRGGRGGLGIGVHGGRSVSGAHARRIGPPYAGYWDMNDASRAWTRRWQAERPRKLPAMTHAGDYSAVIHYLKAVEALKTDGDGRVVAAKMKEMPTDDPLFGKGFVRSEEHTSELQSLTNLVCRL